MKLINSFLVVFLCFSCKPKQMISAKSQFEILNPCPEQGVCKVTLHENSSLEILKDSIGMLYYQLRENKLKHVIEYEYLVKGPDNTADGDLTEKILFELPQKSKSMTLENNALAEVALVYQRLCFCRGETGLVPITQGHFELNAKKNTLKITFQQSQFPQAFDSVLLKIK